MRCAAAALAIALAACGEEPLTAADAVTDSYRVFCERAFACRDGYPGDDFERRIGADEDACVAMLIDDADPPPAAYQMEVDAGRVAYDEGAARVCLDYYRGLTCAELWDDPKAGEPPECASTFVGLVPDGGDCTLAIDCAEDAEYCSNGECTPQP